MKQGSNNSKRSRGRGAGGGGGGGGGGKKPNLRQTYDSNGPDVRIRGNAHQVLERYLSLARDAASAGDRIAAENFYQHAEHYYRVISAAGGFRQNNAAQNELAPADNASEAEEAPEVVETEMAAQPQAASA